MKLFKLLTLIVLLAAASCMKATEDPEVMFNGELINFGDNGNNGSSNNEYNYNELDAYIDGPVIIDRETLQHEINYNGGYTFRVYANNANSYVECPYYLYHEEGEY